MRVSSYSSSTNTTYVSSGNTDLQVKQLSRMLENLQRQLLNITQSNDEDTVKEQKAKQIQARIQQVQKQIAQLKQTSTNSKSNQTENVEAQSSAQQLQTQQNQQAIIDEKNQQTWGTRLKKGTEEDLLGQVIDVRL